MKEKSNIQWTDYTWNIAVGCQKVDADCKFCYMYRDSNKETRYDPFTVRKTKSVFNLPLRIKEGSKIFTSSLTDVFHEDVDSFRLEMWDIIKKCPQHTFQILTKRPERIRGKLPDYWKEIEQRIWLGTSIGSQDSIQRIYDLLNVGHQGVNFLSLEPLHGKIVLPLEEKTEYGKIGNIIDWVIIGGESGNENGKYRYRPCDLDWIESLVKQCQTYNISVFVKQLGTFISKQLNLKDRHGGDLQEFPLNLQIREFPSKKIQPN